MEDNKKKDDIEFDAEKYYSNGEYYGSINEKIDYSSLDKENSNEKEERDILKVGVITLVILIVIVGIMFIVL